MKKKTMTLGEALAYLEEDPSRVLDYYDPGNVGAICLTCPLAQALSALVGSEVFVTLCFAERFLDDRLPLGKRLKSCVDSLRAPLDYASARAAFGAA